MTPREKANELANKMFNGSVFDYNGKEELRKEQNRAKQCTLIAVEEQIKTINWYAGLGMLTNWGNALKYWQEVKNEIEKL